METSRRRQALENGEHKLLFAHRIGVLDFELFGNREQLSRGFALQIVKFRLFQFGDVRHVEGRLLAQEAKKC